jgi:hypothetical protein
MFCFRSGSPQIGLSGMEVRAGKEEEIEREDEEGRE